MAPRRVTVMALEQVLLAPVHHPAALAAEALAVHGVHWWTLPTAGAFWYDAIGRTFAEFASWALRETPAIHADPTLPTLVALEAERCTRAALQHGVLLQEAAVARLRERAHRGDRVIVRSDAPRVIAEMVLERADVADLVAMVRAGDDPVLPPSTAGTDAAAVSRGAARLDLTSLQAAQLVASWDAIVARCDRWGVPRSAIEVYESGLLPAATAQRIRAREQLERLEQHAT